MVSAIDSVDPQGVSHMTQERVKHRECQDIMLGRFVRGLNVNCVDRTLFSLNVDDADDRGCVQVSEAGWDDLCQVLNVHCIDLTLLNF